MSPAYTRCRNKSDWPFHGQRVERNSFLEAASSLDHQKQVRLEGEKGVGMRRMCQEQDARAEASQNSGHVFTAADQCQYCCVALQPPQQCEQFPALSEAYFYFNVFFTTLAVS
ncbi:hypothetical protein NDU88_004453 [Pleurodeles waltl]|uniref:Uncharacterized protein n=1 Tax=Pleurodeles waltl TaxID=8319 RepID=A0AAV7TRE2_PLEWA|nr:hypothetical protein NDU88_004453 [Pleurodeles waltl]